MIDTTAIVWYAAICGTLSAELWRAGARIAIGAVVGIIAASLLLFPKTMMGY